MTQLSVSLKFRSSSIQGKQGSICFRLIKNRIVKSITTPYKIFPEEWDKKKFRIILANKSDKRDEDLREIIIALEEDLRELKAKIAYREKTVGCSIEDAINIYRRKYEIIPFTSFAKEIADEMESAGKNRLAEAYRSAARNIILFNNGNDIPVQDLSPKMLFEYQKFMEKKGNSQNTISFYMRNTRAIYNKAFKKGILESKNAELFSDTFTGVAKTRKRAVKQETIDAIIKLDLNYSFPKKKERKSLSIGFARDMFLMSFFLRGISFIDLAFLKKEDFCRESKTISYIRKKTGQRLEISATPHIMKIIDRYRIFCEKSEFLLPILPPNATRKHYACAIRKQNTSLKILCKLTETNIPLTTYVSRHTWASIARAKGIPVAVISRGLGHESEKTTQIYLDSFDFSMIHKANNIITSVTKMQDEIIFQSNGNTHFVDSEKK